MSANAEREPSSTPALAGEGSRDVAHQFSDIWQRLGISGDDFGTSGRRRRTFLYTFAAAAAIVGVVNIINVITIQHEYSGHPLLEPIVSEGSSWVTFLLFFWMPWLAWTLAPPLVRPRWKLLVHIPTALAFSIAHVAGFVFLRKAIFWIAGHHYIYGLSSQHFFYEFRKDGLGYLLFLAGFTLVDHLLRQQALIDTPGQTLTFDIRDGARLHRVRLDEILAIASAGNYVEFVHQDGRRLLMRSSLVAMENELAPRGFLRTHRSWLVNVQRVTSLKPEGSGDYAIEVANVTIPLSRRFPDALARLRGGV